MRCLTRNYQEQGGRYKKHKRQRLKYDYFLCFLCFLWFLPVFRLCLTLTIMLGLDFKFACRSLLRAKGLLATVILTLALGIGANAAIFSVVRGVLLRPLTNRDEGRLLYIRQSAPGHARSRLYRHVFPCGTRPTAGCRGTGL